MDQLFGDTNAVHIRAANNAAGYRLDNLVEGNTVEDVLKYVQYERPALLRSIRTAAEESYEAGHLSYEEGKQLVRTYQRCLNGYTYLTHTEFER